MQNLKSCSGDLWGKYFLSAIANNIKNSKNTANLIVMSKHFILGIFFLKSLLCLAQVPVSKEPRHHKVFENAFVRVLDVHVPPGDTTQFHKHETPSVFIVLNAVKTGSEVIMEEAKAAALSHDAAISFEGFYTKPRIHRVWNEDTAEFHVMDVEVLRKENYKESAPIQQEGFQLLFDEKPVRAYRLTLNAGKNIQLVKQMPFLVVGLFNTSQNVVVNKKTFSKKGDFLFIQPGDSVQFTNNGQPPYSFAVLEFK